MMKNKIVLVDKQYSPKIIGIFSNEKKAIEFLYKENLPHLLRDASESEGQKDLFDSFFNSAEKWWNNSENMRRCYELIEVKEY